MIRQFEGINIRSLNAGLFRHGAAMTLPGIGIVVGKASVDNRDLLRHEFGHILQFRQWGFLFYWFQMAPASLYSAMNYNHNRHNNHMHCWTEWSANLLSYHYFGMPDDWNFYSYPVSPPEGMPDNAPPKMREKLKIILALVADRNREISV